MSTETKVKNTGRLSWVITILEIIIIFAYFAIGYGGIVKGFENMDFAGMFESVKTAIIFLIAATVVITILCFVPIFKSTSNVRLAIWNIVWIALTIYSLYS
jgi:hypothetical protein